MAIKITEKELRDFLPSEYDLAQLSLRYPVHATFIMDLMDTEYSSIGWFMAGYLFAKDPELSRNYQGVADSVGQGKIQERYDA